MNVKTILNIAILSIGITCIPSCTMENENTHKKALIYPPSEKNDVKDDYFGTQVLDPYRWLENDTSSATAAWVKAQNEVSFAYLNSIPGRAAVRSRLEELWNYPKQSAPFRVGEHYFFSHNDGLQNQAVIMRMKGLDGEATRFIDPNELNKEGTTSVSIVGSSKDGKYVTLDRSEAGSDWSSLTIKNVETGEMLPEELNWVKFSGASWKGDGFYYSRYPSPKKGTEFSETNIDHMVYFHKVGTSQSEDKLVYRNEKNLNLYHWVNVTEDEKYLILYAASGTDGYECFFKDLSQANSEFKPLFKGFEHKSSVVAHHNGRFLVITDIDAPNYRLVSIDTKNIGSDSWKEVVPQKEHLLESISTGGGMMFLNYLEKACNRLYVAKMDGSDVKSIELPGAGSAGGIGGYLEDKVLFYSYTSFNYPTSVFRYNVETGESVLHYRPKTSFNPDAFVSEQVSYTSKDGTPVSMFIVKKKDLKMDGSNPALLYGYGGFNISITPSFSVSNMVFLEKGGVYAVANLRGGGEYGEEWHKAGMLLKKQNVFDDFISAAEYLISEKYTSSDRLAIEGRSNGGLLVGAAITQRPELFAVAFPGVGVMDMLRYHRFTVGWGWIPEYGCADSSDAHFKNLNAYSPLHNLKLGAEYPATMVTTADHDDRVVPAHSFKFTARLQECHTGDEPVIIRIDVNAGHGAGKPVSMVLDELADKWAFFFDNIKTSGAAVQ